MNPHQYVFTSESMRDISLPGLECVRSDHRFFLGG
jgi:hypothetical protein